MANGTKREDDEILYEEKLAHARRRFPDGYTTAVRMVNRLDGLSGPAEMPT